MAEKENAPAGTEAISKTTENNIATAQKIGKPYFDAIPAEMKAETRWAPWVATWNDKRQKFDKVPRRADKPWIGLSTVRDRWYEFDQAVKAFHDLRTDGGVGYLMSGVENFIGIDLDNCVKNGKIAEWARTILDEADTYTEISPSGKGLRLFLRGELDKDFANHEKGVEVYGGNSERFLTVTGNRVDTYPSEIADVAPGFIPWVSEKYKLIPAASVPAVDMPELVEVTALPEVLTPATRAFLERGDYKFDRSQQVAAVTAELYKATVKADGSLDDALVLSMLVDNIYTFGVALDHRRQDENKAIEYLWKQHCCKMRGKVSVADPSVFETLDQAPPVLTRTKSGAVQATRNNIASVLNRSDITGYRLRYDEFRNETMYAPHGTDEWQSFNDEMQTALATILESNTTEEKSFLPIPATLMREMVNFVANQNRFDSAKFWAETRVWDGLPRVDTFLIRYFGAEDTPYHRAISRYLWTALAGRATVPGIKADMVPVARGDQGVRKSTTILAIAPAPEFGGEVNIAARDSDVCRAFRGKLIIEFGELRGLRGQELEHIKALITRQHDEWIGKFKEYATKAPRRMVFFGSTNQTEFLEDVTGNRRWLPFEAGECDPEGVADARDQLWAEGLTLFRKYGIMWEDANRLAEDVRDAYLEVDDVWDTRARAWLNSEFTFSVFDEEIQVELRETWGIPKGTKWRDVPFTTDEILRNLIVSARDSTRADATRIGKVLTLLGFRREDTSRMGLKGRYWRHKDNHKRNRKLT